MWDFNLTFLKCLFQNWHVSTEHLTSSTSVLLTENIFAGGKKIIIILASFIENSQRFEKLFRFGFFYFLLIMWFHCKVVGIDNYAICNPVVFPGRKIPATFLPGLVITSQAFGGWWVLSRVFVIKASGSRGRQMALEGAVVTPQCNDRLFPASTKVDLKPWLFPALHKDSCSSTSWGHFRFLTLQIQEDV